MQRRQITRAFLLTVALRILYSVLASILLQSPDVTKVRGAITNLVAKAYLRSDGWRFHLLEPWQRFDAVWYAEIAAQGYKNAAATVFYPLYPLLMAAFRWALDPMLAGLLISTVAAFFFFWACQIIIPDIRGVFLLCLWPSGFILFAPYPEALLLALMAWSICFGMDGRWWIAGLLGLLAGFTKATGCVVAIPLLWLAWERGRTWKAVPVLLPMLAYPAWQVCVVALGFPNAAAVYAQNWHTSISTPWGTLLDAWRVWTATGDFVVGANLLAIFVVGACSLLPTRKYAAFCFAVLGFFLMKHTDPILQSSIRYSMVAFPAFLAAGLRLRLALIPVGFVLLITQLLCLSLFVNWSLIF